MYTVNESGIVSLKVSDIQTIKKGDTMATTYKEVKIDIEEDLARKILKDTVADSKLPAQMTLNRIFEVGLSVVAPHVAPRCPRLRNNLEKWYSEDYV